MVKKTKPAPAPVTPQALNTEDAAVYLGVKTADTLKFWRRKKIGPEFFRMGRHCMYAVEELDRYLKELRGGAA